MIAFDLKNLNCQDICNKIQKFLESNKPNSENTFLVIRLQEVVNSTTDLIPKLEYKIIQE